MSYDNEDDQNKPVVTQDDPLPGMSSVRVRMLKHRDAPSEDEKLEYQPLRLGTLKRCTGRLFPHQRPIVQIDKDPDGMTMRDVISSALTMRTGALLGINQIRRVPNDERPKVISTPFVDIEHYVSLFKKLTEANDLPELRRNFFIIDSYVDMRNIRPVGERLCVDESHRLNDRSELTDEEKEYLNAMAVDDEDAEEEDDTLSLLRSCLPAGAVEIAPDLFYLPVEAAPGEIPGEIDQRIAAHTHEGGDDKVNIGNGQSMTRSKLREMLGKVNAQTIPFKPVMPNIQALGRVFRDKPVDQMTDDELIDTLDPRAPAGEHKPDLYNAPNDDTIDAMDYPMPGHRWRETLGHSEATLLKSTTRCLWVQVQTFGSGGCKEVHVMSREQFRSFLTRSGEFDDWKTRRPNYKKPQTRTDELRYMLVDREYPDTDQILSDLIAADVPYIEHTPV